MEPPRQPPGVDLGADVRPGAQQHPEALRRGRVQERLQVERPREVVRPRPERLVQVPHRVGLDRVDAHGRQAAEAVAPVRRVGALVVVPGRFRRFRRFRRRRESIEREREREREERGREKKSEEEV